MLNCKINQVLFWNIINALCSIENKVEKEKFLKSKQIHENDFNYVCEFLKSINHPLDLRDNFIYPLHQENIHVRFSMLEWISLQALFPMLDQFEKYPFFNSIVNKFSQIETENSHLDIFEFFNNQQNEINVRRIHPLGLENSESKIKFLEESILDKNSLEIISKEDQKYKILPLQLVFIGGHLEIVCEQLLSQSLISFRISDIDKIIDLDEECKTSIKDKELATFISQLREIEDKTIRLVLKIHSLEKFQLKCKGEAFVKSCMFSNPEGQNIWAATIEPSNEIFEWILGLNGDAEIISPNDFKRDFLSYCEQKINKIA